jgi:6-phosphogluconate dehydrogenase
MIGGDDEVVERLDPIFKTLAPGVGTRRAHAGPHPTDGTAEQGYLHCGPNGAGHFVKMVHNGIEYGMMAAYAEGLNILKQRRRRQAAPSRRRDGAAARPRGLPVRHRHRRGRRGVAPRQRGRLLAARPDRRALAESPDLHEFAGRVSDSGEGRWTVDRRDRRGRARPGAERRAVLPLQPRAARPTSPTSCSRRCASSSAATTRSAP